MLRYPKRVPQDDVGCLAPHARQRDEILQAGGHYPVEPLHEALADADEVPCLGERTRWGG